MLLRGKSEINADLLKLFEHFTVKIKNNNRLNKVHLHYRDQTELGRGDVSLSLFWVMKIIPNF